MDWDLNTAANFCELWRRQCEVLEEGEWGRRVRLFYHLFYGEGFVISPGHTYTRQPNTRPFAGDKTVCVYYVSHVCIYLCSSSRCMLAGIVWSGVGTINNQPLEAQSQDRQEFLVTPGHSMKLSNTSSDIELMVFSVFPLLDLN